MIVFELKTCVLLDIRLIGIGIRLFGCSKFHHFNAVCKFSNNVLWNLTLTT